MRKIQYSAGVKAVMALLEEIFAVILVICIVLLSVLFDRSMVDMRDLKNKSFVKSGYYEELFQKNVNEVLNFLSLKEMFETEGVYDPERTIDIRKKMLQQKGEIKLESVSGLESEFSYTLRDLDEWSRGYALLDNQIVTKFYISEDGSMHQLQTVMVGGNAVMDSETTVQKLDRLDYSLQRIVVDAVQHNYGGYYELENNGVVEGYETNTSASTDVNVGLTAGSADGTDASWTDMNSVQVTEDTQALEGVSIGEQTQTTEEETIEDELLQQSIQKAINGELYELEGEALQVLLESLGLNDFNSEQQGYVVQEEFLPVSDVSILDRFLRGDLTLQQMDRAYNALRQTLEQVGDDISTYKRGVNRYEKNDTNLSYWILLEGQTQAYTNIPDVKTGEQLLEYGNSQGSYFYYNDAEIRLDTNVNGMEDAYYQMESINSGKSHVILVSVNTAFPHEDSFFQAKAEYNSMQPWIMVSLVASIVCAFGLFLSFIYMNMAAGRKPTDEEIHLCWFDKIKTEFMLILFFCSCIGTIALYISMSERFAESELAGLLIMSGGTTFTALGIFMVFYLSLVRRIKGSAMWTGSFLYWVGKGVQKVMRNRKPATKILLVYGIHILACFGIGFLLFIGCREREFGWFYLGVMLFLILSAMEGSKLLKEGIQRNTIMLGIRRIAGGDLEYEIDTTELKGDNKGLGDAVNTIGEGLYHAVDDSTKNERLKADLITNVSHDIKTPLTSIINYVDLIKREDIPNECVQSYIQILDAKSQRLKQLTEDLVEASKVSSGNIELQMERINLVELVYQTGGEFNEKFESRGLTAVTKLPKEPVVIMADGRRIWRVIENLYNNVAKYAMMNTRVYVDMEVLEEVAAFSIKNISEQALNIDASELTERFIRGDVSRSTEGSGLGLSIARNLTELMGGTFDIYLDGDLFKVTITFPRVNVEREILLGDNEGIL